MAGRGALYGRGAALAALVALAVSPYFAVVGHLNLLDPGFTFWLTGAVFAFTLAQSAPRASATERRWMLAAWVAAALAVLSKGIVVGVLAGGSTRRVHAASSAMRAPGGGCTRRRACRCFWCVAAPWFVAVSLRNPSFPEFFFVHEHFARFLTTVHQRVEPWWYFLPLLLLGGAAVVPAARARAAGAPGAQSGAATPRQFKPLRFLLIFAGVDAGVLLRFRLEARAVHPADVPAAGRGRRCW